MTASFLLTAVTARVPGALIEQAGLMLADPLAYTDEAGSGCGQTQAISPIKRVSPLLS